MILGCTHYPIIKEDIAKFFNGNIVDPAQETALELKNLLKSNNLLNNDNTNGEISFYVSGDEKKFKNVAEQFLNFNIERLYKVKK